MARIELTTRIAAPREICFDLARSVEVHTRSTARYGEAAVGGRTAGLLTLGDEVTWRARHFGVWQTLTSRITAYERPVHFRDSMVRGVFARLDHDQTRRVCGRSSRRCLISWRPPSGRSRRRKCGRQDRTTRSLPSSSAGIWPTWSARDTANPWLPDFDGAQIARERNYKALSLAEGMAAFREARLRNVAALRTLGIDDWTRRGEQAGVGAVALCDIPTMMAEHDAAHRQEIQDWMRARRERE